MRRLPLRVRLTLAFAVGMAVVFVALGILLHARFAADLTNGVDLDLRSRAQVIVSAIGRQDPSVVDAGGNLIDPDEAFAQVLAPPDHIVDTSAGVSGAPLLDAAAVSGVRDVAFSTARVVGVDDPVRLLAVPVVQRGEPLVVVVGATLGDTNEALGRLTLLLAVGGPIALAVVSAGGWLLAGAALRPVERMRLEAAAFSTSEFDRRLPVPPTDDELARLGTTLNTMLDRLEEAYRRQGRFVDEASHELRTPLGVLKAELDLALARGRTVDELEAALRNASNETDRLVRLAEDLLVLARARDGRLPVRRTAVPVATLLDQVRTAHEGRAGAAGVTIVVDAPPDLTAPVDHSRTRQAVENLLDNALRHASGGGTVEVRAEPFDGGVAIQVRDQGPGFPPAMLGDPPEPFARPGGDGRTGDGAGLGLAIVRAIAEAHRGTVTLDNAPDGGARVTVRLPGPGRSGPRPGERGGRTLDTPRSNA
jgi:two-component system OmpR family sensor kinase